MAAKVEQLIKPKKFRRGLDLGPPGAVAAQPIEDMPLPPRLYVPLKQHRGALCESKVSPGDQVKIGQILGESADPEAAPIHAPVSGRVISVADHPDPFGRMTLTVTIENDGAEEWLEPPSPDPQFQQKKLSAMMRAVRLAGWVVPRSGRPVYTMLAPPERPRSYIFLVGIPQIKPVRLLVVSTLDLEPTLAVNRRLLIEAPEEINLGVEMIKKMVGAKDSLTVVDQSLNRNASTQTAPAGTDLKPVYLKNRYPVAWPELLTTALTGLEVPWPEGEPRDVGVLILEADTVLGVLEAIQSGRPQIDRIISVTGPEMTPRNLRVRIGTPFKDIISFVGGDLSSVGKIIVGGLMSGYAQYTDLAPVTKETLAVTLMADDELVAFSEHICIKCGRCVGVCPMRLLPNVITNFCEFGHFADAAEAELFKCIECGCCAYVCPAKRPLVHYIKHGKAEVTAMRTAT